MVVLLQLRSALWNIWKTLPDILHVLVLWLSSIGLFALMAYKLLKERYACTALYAAGGACRIYMYTYIV